MNREEYKHSLLELLLKEKEIRKQFDIDIKNINDEINLIQEEYAKEHSEFWLGNNVIYTNIDGIEYNRIIHSMRVLHNGDIVYDIGDIIKITHTNVYKGRLKKKK